jgi:CHASE3 domain sensor protein
MSDNEVKKRSLTRKIALFFAIIFLLLSIFILIVFSKNGE